MKNIGLLQGLWLVAIPGLFLLAARLGLCEITAQTLLIVLLCACFELVDSSLGMGYGTSLTPILLYLGFEPRDLVPIILISEVLSGFSASFFHAGAGNVRFHRGSIHLRAAVILSVSSFVGVFIGVTLAFELSKLVLTRLIGSIILLSGVTILIFSRRTFAFRTWKISLLATVASFNKAVSGGGYGPLITSGQILSGLDARAAVGVTSLAEGFTCLAAATLFLARGQAVDPGLLVPVLAGALLSTPFSAHIVKRVREDRLRVGVGLFTLCLGVLTLLRAVTP